MSTVEELTKALEEKTAITEALKEKVKLLEALVAQREERLAAVLEMGDASGIPEGIPGTSGDLDRTASVAKYTPDSLTPRSCPLEPWSVEGTGRQSPVRGRRLRAPRRGDYF